MVCGPQVLVLLVLLGLAVQLDRRGRLVRRVILVDLLGQQAQLAPREVWVQQVKQQEP